MKFEITEALLKEIFKHLFIFLAIVFLCGMIVILMEKNVERQHLEAMARLSIEQSEIETRPRNRK